MAALLITPSLVTTTPAGLQTFVASGGSGSGYVFSFLSNNSGGTISPTGDYVAGLGGFLDIVLLTDSLDNSTSAAVTVIGLSEFQGIGLLPQLTAIPSPTPSDAGDFLHTDGFVVTWEPISGLLPDQAGHAGQILTTDGAAASWAPIGDTLPDQTGHSGAYLTTDGVDPSWSLVPPIATNNVHDVRLYGAVANDPTNDLSIAYYNAMEAWTQQSALWPLITETGIFGGIYIPEGNWYTSRPLCQFTGCQMYGDGPELTIISPGIGTPSTPGNVQGFAGPVIYVSAPWTPTTLPFSTTNFPKYSTPLVGGVGKSLRIPSNTDTTFDNSLLQLYLHDSYPWSVMFGNDFRTTVFSLQFWVRLDVTPINGLYLGIIGSRGPNLYDVNFTLDGAADLAFGVYCTSDGVDLFLRAYLTTNPAWTNIINTVVSGTLHKITSTAVTAATPVHVEIDYNGSFFDFYVNGVNQGHVAATGPVIRAPWEAVAIGGQGAEGLDVSPTVAPCQGAIDSIRLSRIARHTGTGSFTPPVAKYTWDSDTFALYNWDQSQPSITPTGGPLWTLPFVAGQIVAAVAPGSFAQPGLGGPCPHYIRFSGGTIPDGNYMHDFAITCMQGCSGIITFAAPRTIIERVWINMPSMYGIRIGTAVSFFTKLRDIYVAWAPNTGVQYFGNARNIQAVGCAIGVHVVGGGVLDDFNNMSQFNTFCMLYCGPGSGAFEPLLIQNCANDAEVYSFTRQKAVAVFTGAFSTLQLTNNAWSTGAASSPPLLFFEGGSLSGQITSDYDIFLSGTGPASVAEWYGTPQATLMLRNPTIIDANIPPKPLSSQGGWITQFDGKGITNQTGLSTSDIKAKNLSGTFTIQFGYTSGGPRFLDQEADGNYDVVITPKGYLGSAPAAGSTTITGYTTGPDGFVATVGVDPGGTCTLIFSWFLIRAQPPPLYFSYLPTIPSSITNPLLGLPTNQPWAVGVTLVPAVGNVFTVDTTRTQETVIEMGTTVLVAPWWEISIVAFGAYPQGDMGTIAGGADSFVAADGQLRGLMNPGAHNFILYYTGTSGNYYIDGEKFPGFILPSAHPGTQLTPLHIGEQWDASNPLTVATLRNLKIDYLPSRVISNDNDIGPAAMAQAAFLGDDWTMGNADNSGNGGYASQIAQNRYGTTYYWMAAIYGAELLGSPQTTGSYGLLENIWKPWAGAITAPTLTGLNIMAGYWDILIGPTGTGDTAAHVWAGLLAVLEGSAASATWIAPTSNSSPTQQRAFGNFIPPTSGTATCVVNGTSFLCTVVPGDYNTTCSNLIALVVADGPTNALVSCAVQPRSPDVPDFYVQFTARTPGTVGNAITGSTNGNAGAFWYGDIGGIDGTALAVNFLRGADTTCIINGVSFPGNFDTNAATTVANLQALIAANGTINALVTTSLVSGNMLVAARTNGAAGNNIRATGNGINVPGGIAWSGRHNNATFAGGSNGAVDGIATIVLCTVPPFGTTVQYTAGKETQRNSLNTLISAYVHAGVTIADVSVLLRDAGAHQNLDPTFDTGTGTLNAAGHTALYGLIEPLLP